jgi:ketosteroid isomerase-like protein
MKFRFLIIILTVLFHTLVFLQSVRQKQIILNSIKVQEAAWNNGNIEGYMAYYWNSDSLKFIGKSGITYGWKTTLDHYKKSYPDKAAMGKLIFAEIRMKKINCKMIMVTGSWKLERDKDNLSGYFSLLWKKIKGKWLIIVDHTS